MAFDPVQLPDDERWNQANRRLVRLRPTFQRFNRFVLFMSFVAKNFVSLAAKPSAIPRIGTTMNQIRALLLLLLTASIAHADLRYTTKVEVRGAAAAIKAFMPPGETATFLSNDALRIEQL